MTPYFVWRYRPDLFAFSPAVKIKVPPSVPLAGNAHPRCIYKFKSGRCREKEKAHRMVCFSFWRYRPDLNWRIMVLQTMALPLGYGTI